MATSSVPVPQPAIRAAGFLAHPLQSFSVTLTAWMERRRERADAALLMKLEPHMLRDIGVTLAEHRGARGMLKWHPAVLATTMEPNHHAEEERY